MSETTLFWIAISAIACLFFLVSLREIILLISVPKGHPDRGFFWFNAVFLLVAVAGVIYGGAYLDAGRRGFESLLSPYPHARYAYERNGVIHGTTWVYVTNDDGALVRAFYRDLAEREHLELVVDDADHSRLSFTLPSGRLFLTIKNEDGSNVLYFSREGEITTATVTPH